MALRVTAVPLLKLFAQLVPQLIPLGELVTVPEPVTVTVRARDFRLNVAVALLAAVIGITQLAESGQETPLALQPPKSKSLSGMAVSVTLVPPG